MRQYVKKYFALQIYLSFESSACACIFFFYLKFIFWDNLIILLEYDHFILKTINIPITFGLFFWEHYLIEYLCKTSNFLLYNVLASGMSWNRYLPQQSFTRDFFNTVQVLLNRNINMNTYTFYTSIRFVDYII